VYVTFRVGGHTSFFMTQSGCRAFGSGPRTVVSALPNSSSEIGKVSRVGGGGGPCFLKKNSDVAGHRIFDSITPFFQSAFHSSMGADYCDRVRPRVLNTGLGREPLSSRRANVSVIYSSWAAPLLVGRMGPLECVLTPLAHPCSRIPVVPRKPTCCSARGGRGFSRCMSPGLRSRFLEIKCAIHRVRGITGRMSGEQASWDSTEHV